MKSQELFYVVEGGGRLGRDGGDGDEGGQGPVGEYQKSDDGWKYEHSTACTRH